MLTIYPNLKSIILRFFLIIVLSVVLYLVITNLIIKGDGKGVGVLYFMCLALVFLIINIVLTLFGIIKVEADETSGEITFSRLFSKKTIHKQDIIAYSTSVSDSRGGAIYGRVIKMKDSKIIALSSVNLQDVTDIDDLLKKHDIKYLGEKRSFYPFSAGL
jgi:hypothetical protein